MNTHTILLSAALAPLLLAGPDIGRTPATVPNGYVCPHTKGPIAIDGVMQERAWRAASWTADFVDIEGPLRVKPRFRTRVKMLWDDSYLYIGAEIEEPHVCATLTKRDTVIFYDNDFEVFIDPNGDNHEYYEMEMNALNTVWDLFLNKPYKDKGSPLDSWDIAGLVTAVHVRGTLNNPSDKDTGWSVEIAMPWKALGAYAHRAAPPKIGEQWRINFSRVEWQYDIVDGSYQKVKGTKEDNWVWSAQGVVDMHRPEMWGYLQFGGPNARPSEFRPDPARRAKTLLMSLYYAEREFENRNNRYTVNLDELGLGHVSQDGLATPLAVSLTAEGYIATVSALLPKGKKETWFVKEDSRLWKEE